MKVVASHQSKRSLRPPRSWLVPGSYVNVRSPDSSSTWIFKESPATFAAGDSTEVVVNIPGRFSLVLSLSLLSLILGVILIVDAFKINPLKQEHRT